MRLSEMLSTCAVPSRFHGKPVTRVRANSTATQRNGAADQRAAIVAARPTDQAQQQTEQAVIKPQIKTKEKQSQQSQRRAQAAVFVHGVINPVTRARIPEDSGNICQQKRLPRLRRLKIDGAIDLQHARRPRPQERHDQRSKATHERT